VIETESHLKLSEMKGEFTVQVIAIARKSRAVRTAKNLEFSGYNIVRWKRFDEGRRLGIQVVFGRYASRDDAKKQCRSFAEQLQAHYVIDKVRLK